MPSALVSLVAAAAFFVLLHLGIAETRLRDGFVRMMGEGLYFGLFSAASLGSLIWLAMAYGAAAAGPYASVWGHVRAARWLGLLLVGLGFVLGVAGLLTKNPTAVGGARMLEGAWSAPALLRITRHPFLWGVVLWALAHLIFNGDVPSLIFFGAFFAVALLGTISIDRKRARLFGAHWESFAQETSDVPGAALIAGRTRLRPRALPWLKFLVGLLVFGALLHWHARLFGVSPLPPMGVNELVAARN